MAFAETLFKRGGNVNNNVMSYNKYDSMYLKLYLLEYTFYYFKINK